MVVNEAVEIGDGPHHKPIRQEIMRFLWAVPGLAQTMRKVSAQDVFHVVMSRENAHLFKEAADGFHKPALRAAKGKIVENVNLAKVMPDYSRLAADLAAQVQMAAVMAKLDRIEQAVERVGNDNKDARRNSVAGSIAALDVARSLSRQQERRTQMLLACNNAVTSLKVLAGQLKSDIKAMPSEEGSFFEYFFSDKLEDARKAFDAVTADMAAMATGCKAVLSAYEELGERAAARVAFASFLRDIEASGLEDAARKARLVPGTRGKPAPETLIAEFKGAAKDLDGHLLVSDRDRKPLAIRMDIKPGDWEIQP